MNRWKMIPPVALGLLVAAAWAVTPSTWKHNNEAVFDSADRDGVVVDSHGDVTLARKIDILMPSEDAPDVVSAVAVDDGAIFAASGSDGRIFRIADGKAEPFAELPATLVTTLARHGRWLLAGGGGEQGGLYRVSRNGEVEPFFRHEDVSYIWDIAEGKNGELFVATGPKAKIFRLDAQGNGEMIYEIPDLAKNILCLRRIGDRLLAGTDSRGLVVEIDPAAKTGRVLLDAPEQEISAILPDGEGGLFVSTSDARGAKGEVTTNGTKTGRPEADEEPAEPAPEEPQEPEEGEGEEDIEDEGDEEGEQAPPEAEEPEEEIEEAEPAETEMTEDKPGIRKEGGKLIVTLPPGKNLPIVERGGKRFYILRHSNTGKPVGVPVEKVEVRHVGDTRSADAEKPKDSKSEKPSGAPAPKPSSAKGNAVYHIQPDGIIRTIYRRPVSIHAMVAQGGRLILATGNDGQILYLTDDGMLRGELVDTEARQVTALVEAPGGELIFATANAGSVGRVGNRFVGHATLTSKPLDAKQYAHWGTMELVGRTPAGTTLTVATRSGNVGEPDETTWSSWSKEMPLESGYVSIGSPPARFLQYRITMTSDGSASPSLGSVEIIYQVQNMAPVVAAISVEATEKGPNNKTADHKAFRVFKLKAGDPNRDSMKMRVDYRPIDTDAWVKVADDLDKPEFTWDTRTVSDGKYELRFTASDEPSNPPATALSGSRVSEPVIVDNTPPELPKLSASVEGRTVSIRGEAQDASSRITEMRYSVDSASDWEAFLPADGICDSTREELNFEIADLEPGPHRITIRVTDAFGNTVYRGLNVTVGG